MAERADAARNRTAILAAAERLIGERGIDGVCMEDVALAAGVGKGTVFRRFGDKERLIQAVVDQSANQWHAYAEMLLEDTEVPANDRVVACTAHLFDQVAAALPLVIALERVSERSSAGNFAKTHERLTGLIEQVRGAAQAPFLAHALLANLRAQQIEFLLRSGMSLKQIRSGVVTLAEALMTGSEADFRFQVVRSG